MCKLTEGIRYSTVLKYSSTQTPRTFKKNEKSIKITLDKPKIVELIGSNMTECKEVMILSENRPSENDLVYVIFVDTIKREPVSKENVRQKGKCNNCQKIVTRGSTALNW